MLAAGQDWRPSSRPNAARGWRGWTRRRRRSLSPAGAFQVGEMEAFPCPDATGDVATGFNAVEFPADPPAALRAARRVVRPGGRVAMAVWGSAEDCEISANTAVLGQFVPPPPPGS